VAKFRILLKASAAKEIEKVGSKSDRRRIIEKIDDSAGDPRLQGSENRAGYDDRHRVHQGDCRIVYLNDDEHLEVTVYKVAHRKDVYR